MWIRALRGLAGDYGDLAPGQVRNVAKDVGLSLVERGLAVAHAPKAEAGPTDQAAG